MKIFLLIIALIGIISYSNCQHKEIILPEYLENRVEKFPDYPLEPISSKASKNFLFRSLENETVGETWYDLQTYNSVQRRMFAWSDGAIGIAWIMAFQTGAWPDLGTGYNYFDGNNWGSIPNERVENDLSSGTNYCPFEENGEIIVSHFLAENWTLSFNKRENKGQGDWEDFVLEGPQTGVGLAWPSMIINGQDNNTIHIVAKTTGDPYMGQNSAFVYSRSEDGDTTWDIQHHYFDELSADYFNNIARDCYTWATPKGDTIAFTAGFSTGHGCIMKSFDNGNNWEKIYVYENPFSPYQGGATPLFGSGDGTSSLALDSQGNAHVVFGRMVYYYDAPGNLYYFPATEGVIYWNETMEELDTTSISSYTLDYLIDGGNLIGWVTSGSGDSTLMDWGTYYLSLTTWPQIIIDQDDRIFVIYSGVAPEYDNGLMNYRHIYGNSSNDGGVNWNGLVNLTTDISLWLSECIFPALSPAIVDNKFHFYFMEDGEPGLFVWTGQQTSPSNNKIKYMSHETAILTGERKYNYEDQNKVQILNNFPNPFTNSTRIELFLTGNTEVLFRVFDLSGKVVYTKNLGVLPKGRNSIKFENKNLSPGIYLYKFISGSVPAYGKLEIR